MFNAFSITARGSILATLVLLMSTGCGYHLRGQHKLAPELQTLAINAPASQIDLSRSLRRQLNISGVTVAETGAETFSLNIVSGEEEQRTVSYTGDVKTGEREIVATTEFELRAPDGTAIVGPMKIITERIYIHDRDQLLGEADEQDTLRREMRDDTANRILTILRRVSSEQIKRSLEASQAAAS